MNKSKPKQQKSQIPGSWPGDWKEKTTKRLAWLELVQTARHDPKYPWKGSWEYSVIPGQEHKKVKIPFLLDRGQVGIVKSEMAIKWRWSRPKLDRYLEGLKDSGRISQISHRGIGTIITFLNFDKENMPPLWK